MKILGRANAKLCARHTGQLGAFVENNIGISQWVPLSAQRFIIYDDHSMQIYTSDTKNTQINVPRTQYATEIPNKMEKYILDIQAKNTLAIKQYGDSKALNPTESQS